MNQESDLSPRDANFLLGVLICIQMINVLDFVMAMPLGPAFAASLDFPESQIGWVASAYAGAAALSGLIGSRFLDRFDRKTALLTFFTGLIASTALGGLAYNFSSLIAARLLAGCFGGPTTALLHAIVSDVFPFERRGKALSALMGVFSIVSIIGIPSALWLAEATHWRIPFFVLATLGVPVAILAQKMLPPLKKHLQQDNAAQNGLVLSKNMLLSFVILATMAFANFILIPNIAPYAMHNLNITPRGLGFLYLFGGMVNFLAMLLGGRIVDRFGSMFSAWIGILGVCTSVFLGFFLYPPLLPPVAIFAGFMSFSGIRYLAYTTLSSQIPRIEERARFSSLQNATQNIASAIATGASTFLLTNHSNGALIGIPRLALLCILLHIALIPLFFWLQKRVLNKADASSLKIR